MATVPRRALGGAPTACHRFALSAAGTGGTLFLAGMAGAAGTWSVAAGAVSLTVASLAGVIAMEGNDPPRVHPPRRRPDRSPGS